MSLGLNLITGPGVSSTSPSLSPSSSSSTSTKSPTLAASAVVQAATAAGIYLQQNGSNGAIDWGQHQESDVDDMNDDEDMLDYAESLSSPPPTLNFQSLHHRMEKHSHSSCSPPPILHHMPSQKPSYCTPNPVPNIPENNVVKLLDYRNTKMAAFTVEGRELMCLPQAFEHFLKHLVGGLHTVYTKLKRLEITPVVCNVEQVRILRGLGAIQPGVNRCKLIAAKEFDVLYDDCTNSNARPGRPPKRSMTSSPDRHHLPQHSSQSLSGAALGTTSFCHSDGALKRPRFDLTSAVLGAHLPTELSLNFPSNSPGIGVTPHFATPYYPHYPPHLGILPFLPIGVSASNPPPPSTLPSLITSPPTPHSVHRLTQPTLPHGVVGFSDALSNPAEIFMRSFQQHQRKQQQIKEEEEELQQQQQHQRRQQQQQQQLLQQQQQQQQLQQQLFQQEQQRSDQLKNEKRAHSHKLDNNARNLTLDNHTMGSATTTHNEYKHFVEAGQSSADESDAVDMDDEVVASGVEGHGFHANQNNNRWTSEQNAIVNNLNCEREADMHLSTIETLIEKLFHNTQQLVKKYRKETVSLERKLRRERRLRAKLEEIVSFVQAQASLSLNKVANVVKQGTNGSNRPLLSTATVSSSTMNGLGASVTFTDNQTTMTNITGLSNNSFHKSLDIPEDLSIVH